MTTSPIGLPGTHQEAAPAVPVGRVWVWDAPLRLFHWLLVAAVAVAIVTGELGGDWMRLHGQAGLLIVGLLVFRVVWGVVGSAHARFAQFLPTPARLRAYVRGEWQGQGHNPLGAFSVLALIGLLGWQAGTGLFGNDEIAYTGPLSSLVDETVAGRLTHWHQQSALLLFALLGLHLAAIAFYLWARKTDLVRPMVTGWKSVSEDEGSRGDESVKRAVVRVRSWALLLALALAATAVWSIVRAGQAQDSDTPAAKVPAAAASPAASSAW